MITLPVQMDALVKMTGSGLVLAMLRHQRVFIRFLLFFYIKELTFEKK